MVFQSVADLTAALAGTAALSGDRLTVTGTPSPDLVDRLAHTAAFGASPEVKGTARWVILNLAAHAGIRFASIHDLYLAMGRGEAGGFTVPAINVRAMAYDTGRAVIRAAKKLDAGAFILEIARSEIGYTEQRPHEYAAIMAGRGAARGLPRAALPAGRPRAGERQEVRRRPIATRSSTRCAALIREEIAAGFYNIDIDTSTLVDLDQPTLAEQQAVNCELAADFTAFIRQHEPEGVTVSVGGEIGEVGGKNSDVHELHAFMEGYNEALARQGPGPDRHQQDQRPDRHRPRRLRRPRRQGQERREDRPRHAAGAVARGPRAVRAGRRGTARRLDAERRGLRRVPAGRRLRDPPRHQLPEHGLRPPGVPGGAEGRDVRLGARARAGREEAEGHRRAVPLQGPQEGDRALQAAAVGPAGGGARHHRRHPRGSVRVPDVEAEDPRHRPAVVAKFVTPATALPSLENARLAAAGKITSEERKAEGLAD